MHSPSCTGRVRIRRSRCSSLSPRAASTVARGGGANGRPSTRTGSGGRDVRSTVVNRGGNTRRCSGTSADTVSDGGSGTPRAASASTPVRAQPGPRYSTVARRSCSRVGLPVPSRITPFARRRQGPPGRQRFVIVLGVRPRRRSSATVTTGTAGSQPSSSGRNAAAATSATVAWALRCGCCGGVAVVIPPSVTASAAGGPVNAGVVDGSASRTGCPLPPVRPCGHPSARAPGSPGRRLTHPGRRTPAANGARCPARPPPRRAGTGCRWPRPSPGG